VALGLGLVTVCAVLVAVAMNAQWWLAPPQLRSATTAAPLPQRPHTGKGTLEQVEPEQLRERLRAQGWRQVRADGEKIVRTGQDLVATFYLTKEGRECVFMFWRLHSPTHADEIEASLPRLKTQAWIREGQTILSASCPMGPEPKPLLVQLTR
jgi:hypothetical protein